MVVMLLALITSSAFAAPLRANYEISLTDGGKTYSIRTIQSADADNRFVEDIGPFRLQMVATVNSIGVYEFEISVTRKGVPPGTIAFEQTRSFSGAIGGPLEFSAQFGDVKGVGAVIIRSPER